MNEREPTREDAPGDPGETPPPDPPPESIDPPPAKPDKLTENAEPRTDPGDPPPATEDRIAMGRDDGERDDR